MENTRYAATVPLLAALILALASAAHSATLRCETHKDLITVKAGEQTTLLYRHTPGPFKVYVKELRTPAGIQVLLDSPHDHVHHHALMYAIGVDGSDFWGEFPQHKPGKQVPRGDTAVGVTTADGIEQATIAQEVDWVEATGRRVLEEQRRIALTIADGRLPIADRKSQIANRKSPIANPQLPATLVTWSSRFATAKGMGTAKLWGRHYFGLGLRVVRELDKGTFLNASGSQGAKVRGSEQNVAAAWCAYQASHKGKPVTIAMFSHPANPRHPTTWFTMNAPFGYMTATLDLKKRPMVLRAGQTLHVVYGVALWDGTLGAEAIGKMYQRWTAMAPKPEGTVK
ncbi:PmoA family protein [bacterium]|nr:PmoA family protein [bacterium]